MSAPAPMMAGPRTDERTTRAPGLHHHAPLDRAVLAARRPPGARARRGSRRLASSMSSRRPVSFHQPVTSCGSTREAAVDEVLDRVGDLQLAARRGPDRLGRLHDRRGEHVDARPARGRCGARPASPPAAPPGRPPARRRRRTRGRARAGAGSWRRWRRRGSGPPGSVMPSRSRLSPRYITNGESPRNASAVSTAWARPSGASCADVGHPDPERRAVADGGLDLGLRVAHDDPDVGHAGRAQRLEAVEQHRLVGDRHELLGAGVGDRAQARSGAPGQHQTLECGGHGGRLAPARGGGRAPGPPLRSPGGSDRVARAPHLPGGRLRSRATSPPAPASRG